MRKSFLMLAAVGIAAGSVSAQSVDLSSFIQNSTLGGTLVQDPEAPVSFTLAPGWKLTGGMRWGDHETTLRFVETPSGITVSLYYQYPLQPPFPADTDLALRQAMQAKVRQRQNEGLPDYRVRPDSIRTRQVGGQPALSFVAEFARGDQTRTEYMLRVLGKGAKAHFFVMGIPAAEDINAFCQRFEPIAASLRIP